MQTKLGFWSYSTHLKNKVIPSIKNNKKIIFSGIFTKKKNLIKSKILKKIKIFKQKKDFLNSDLFDTVYISSVNNNHFSACAQNLTHNKNVICEKPICTNPEQLKKLIAIAKKNKLSLREVYQYKFHPLFIKIKKILQTKKIGKLTYCKSEFTVPLNDKKNFRFNKKLGGGALYDVGVYPLTIPFFLFDKKKYKIIYAKINYSKINKIDISGKSIINLDGLVFDSSWGFGMDYKNYIYIKGTKGEIKANFIFSKKILQSGTIELTFKEKKYFIKVPKSNQINLAFNYYIESKSTWSLKKSILILNLLKKVKNFSNSKIKLKY